MKIYQLVCLASLFVAGCMASGVNSFYIFTPPSKVPIAIRVDVIGPASGGKKTDRRVAIRIISQDGLKTYRKDDFRIHSSLTRSKIAWLDNGGFIIHVSEIDGADILTIEYSKEDSLAFFKIEKAVTKSAATD